MLGTCVNRRVAAVLGSTTLQPCSPENWATSTGRQQGHRKPMRGLWWPPRMAQAQSLCSNPNPSPGLAPPRRGQGRYRSPLARRGCGKEPFPLPSSRCLPGCSAPSSAMQLTPLSAVCESHQYFMEQLPPGEGLLSALPFCCSYQPSSSCREQLISSHPWPAPNTPPSPPLSALADTALSCRDYGSHTGQELESPAGSSH